MNDSSAELAETFASILLTLHALTWAIARQPGIDPERLRTDLQDELSRALPDTRPALKQSISAALLKAADTRQQGSPKTGP